MAQIIEISPRHEAIILFILANPTLRMKDVALKFGVTQPWLSTLLRSDLIRARLHDLQGVIADELCVSVKDQVDTLARESLQRLTERISLGAIENDDLIDAAELAVKLVLQPQVKQQGVHVHLQQTNVYPAVDQETLRQAREKMLLVVQPEPQLEAGLSTPLELDVVEAEHVRVG